MERTHARYPTIREQAATSLRSAGAVVEAIQTDLARTEGVDKLYDAAGGRTVDALLANAGRGLGHAFLDQDFNKARRVIDTNVTGTVYLIPCGQKIRTVDEPVGGEI